MSLRAFLYFLFTALLAGVMVGIIVYCYGRRRKDRMEAPKYRMLADDDNLPGRTGGDREA